MRDEMSDERKPEEPAEAKLSQKRWWWPDRWESVKSVRSVDQLTSGERAADAMRNGLGSWNFVFSALIFLTVWMIYNRNTGFDKYPFILLNLVLSCLAAMQGAILLIAAKRADQISSELAHHDYEADVETKRMVHELSDVVAAIHSLTVQLHELTVQVRDHIVKESAALPARPVTPGKSSE